MSDFKKQAYSLKDRAKSLGYDIKLTHCQELVAQIHGFSNRHALLVSQENDAIEKQMEVPTSSKDLLKAEYSKRKMVDLVKDINQLDMSIVCTLLLEGMNMHIKEIDSVLDDNGITHIGSAKGISFVVLSKPIAEVSTKYIYKVIKGMVAHQYSRGFLITLTGNYESEIDRMARANFIEILDIEDLKDIAAKIDAGIFLGKPMHISEDIDAKFDLKEYEKQLSSNYFKDIFNLGYAGARKENSQLHLSSPYTCDFFNKPNALFLGEVGSGRTLSCFFTTFTWMLNNSSNTKLFVCDLIKGAKDYQVLTQLPDVTLVNEKEKFNILIDSLYQELAARKQLFQNERCENLNQLENKGINLPRVVVVIEEFHSVFFSELNFDNNYRIEGSSAHKYLSLLRIGRSFGIWIIASSSKATSEEIPKELIGNFTQKQIFKVSSQESEYLLGHSNASKIKKRGFCYTKDGARQFPALSEVNQRDLLKKFIKPLKNECLFLTKKYVSDMF